MKNRIPNLLVMTVLMAAVCAGAAVATQAQRGKVEIVPSKFKPVRFSVPNGYSKETFPEGRSGLRMLDQNRTDVVYLVYPKTGEAPDILLTLLKSVAIDTFLRDQRSTLTWTSAPLPAHEGWPTEVGTLYSTTRGDVEIQLAQYSRTMGVTKIVYGYYAMRHSSEHRGDAPFLDNLGLGVSDFDKFWKSIREQK